MTVAQADVTGGALGRHLSKIVEDASERVEWSFPSRLATKADRSEYAERTRRAMFAASWPDTLEGRKLQGAKVRERVLRSLNQLALKPCRDLPVTRAQAMRLAQLVLFCTRCQDWASRWGPVIGASSRVLAKYLGVNDVNEAITPLLKLGLIALWNPQGNGRRWYHVINEDCPDERPAGSGWSLAPLILNLKQIEDALERDKQRLAARERISSDIAGRIQSLRECLRDTVVDLDPSWGDAVDALAQEYHNARKGRVERLEELQHRSRSLLADLEGIALSSRAVSREELAGLTCRHDAADIYDQEQDEELRTGLAGSREGDRERSDPSLSLRSKPRPTQRGADAVINDYYADEAPTLFPNIDQLYDTKRAPSGPGNIQLGHIAGITVGMVRRCEQTIGISATCTALMLIGERMARNEIRTRPDAYLAGMLKKHAAGSLHLRYSVQQLRRIHGIGGGTERRGH